MAALKAALARFSGEGRVDWIGVRPGRRAAMDPVSDVHVDLASGLVGDRARGNGQRAVTLIQAEHLPVIAALSRRDKVAPEELRRNVVVSGVNLLALRGRRFRVGAAVLEGIAPCHPCTRMEAVLGPGGLNAMRGHGGLAARVAAAGCFRCGDAVIPLPEDDPEGPQQELELS